jgi:hypothetical protein
LGKLKTKVDFYADFTELSAGQFNFTDKAKLPHPREKCLTCKPGQVRNAFLGCRFLVKYDDLPRQALDTHEKR